MEIHPDMWNKSKHMKKLALFPVFPSRRETLSEKLKIDRAIAEE